MANENFNMEEITAARRAAIADSIRAISIDEVKALGETLFPTMDHPWRNAYFDFIKENAGEKFHHAVTDDHIHFIYCHHKERGIWFLPGSGKGPMRATGLKVLKEVVESKPGL